MLFLHIGLPKTGSTAIQGFLKSHVAELVETGFVVPELCGSYSHNSLAQDILRNDGGPRFDALIDAARRSGEGTVVVSSEMISRNNTLQRFLDMLPTDVAQQTVMLCYLRRQDLFLESLYKQKLKTGRISLSPWQFWLRKREKLDYLGMLDLIAARIGHRATIPRIFEVEALRGGNVVTDFLGQLDADATWCFDPPPRKANQTFSREFSVEMNRLAQGKRPRMREMSRAAARLNPQGIFRTRDVYTPAERHEILKTFESRNEALRAVYFPRAGQLFDMRDIAGDEKFLQSAWEKRKQTDRLAAEAAGRLIDASIKSGAT